MLIACVKKYYMLNGGSSDSKTNLAFATFSPNIKIVPFTAQPT